MIPLDARRRLQRTNTCRSLIPWTLLTKCVRPLRHLSVSVSEVYVDELLHVTCGEEAASSRHGHPEQQSIVNFTEVRVTAVCSTIIFEYLQVPKVFLCIHILMMVAYRGLYQVTRGPPDLRHARRARAHAHIYIHAHDARARVRAPRRPSARQRVPQ
eukprot:COSAG02_NODE_160_length_32694_cov_18.496947_6_plen_157_part_00